MTLSEAARTGRKFWRKSKPEQVYWLAGLHVMTPHPTLPGSAQGWVPNAEELCALDWEAEPLALLLTAADVIRAARTPNVEKLATSRKLAPVEFARLLCIELGLLEEA